MKKLPLFLSFLLWASLSHAAETVVQRIGLSLDPKSPNRNIELVLRKVILSVEERNQNVRITSADKADLEFSDIRELNGNVLMRMVRKSGVYQIELYQADRDTALIDDSTRLSLREFGSKVEETAVKLAGIIAKKFPPKPVQELTRIDVKKVVLSEFESQSGYWSVAVMPAYANIDQEFRVSMSNEGEREKYFNQPGWSVQAEAIYRVQKWNFGVRVSGGMAGGEDYSSVIGSGNIFAGYGLFGSLFILSVEANVFYAGMTTDWVNPDTNFQMHAPVVSILAVQPGFGLQFNLTRDYFIYFSVMLPFEYNHLGLDFSRVPSYQNLALKSNGGIPFITFLLNMRIAGGLRAILSYQIMSREIHTDTMSIDPEKRPIPLDESGIYTLRGYNCTVNRIGLGVMYEF